MTCIIVIPSHKNSGSNPASLHISVYMSVVKVLYYDTLSLWYETISAGYGSFIFMKSNLDILSLPWIKYTYLSTVCQMFSLEDKRIPFFILYKSLHLPHCSCSQIRSLLGWSFKWIHYFLGVRVECHPFLKSVQFIGY